MFYISFYICRYHFSQLYRASFSIIRRKFFGKSFLFFTNSLSFFFTNSILFDPGWWIFCPHILKFRCLVIFCVYICILQAVLLVLNTDNLLTLIHSTASFRSLYMYLFIFLVIFLWGAYYYCQESDTLCWTQLLYEGH